MLKSTNSHWNCAAPIAALCLMLFLALPAARAQTAGVNRPGASSDPWVAQTLRRMPLRDKIAQLVHIRVTGRFLNRRNPAFLELEERVRRNHVGGVILFAGNIYESAVLLNKLQAASPLPLLVAADFERGASFRIADTTSFPWTMAIGATGSEEFAYAQGAITAKESRALGVHWIFAPVLDVNNNPDNPVINIRAYGEDPQLVSRLGCAFIRGARENGVLTTAKHFPGHGDTATDSHIGLPVVPFDESRLESVELAPFRSALAAGVDSVMTAHVAVPGITGEPETPATMSGRILTTLLRGKLGFHGLIVTDALEMGSITTRYWTGQAAVLAIQAGADLLLLPPDPEVAIEEVARAVERGDISLAQINRSVEKVLATKARLGLHKNRTISIEGIDEVVGSQENQRMAQAMADRSVTLIKDDARLLPINPVAPPRLFSLVLSADLDPSPGAIFQAEMGRRFPGVRIASVDPRTSAEVIDGVLENAKAANVIICATLVRIIAGSGSIAIPKGQQVLMDRLAATGKPIVWVALGNPYVLRVKPEMPTYLCTFGYSDVSQIAAAKAISGEIPITGRLPISIPGCAKFGDGLQVPRIEMTLKRTSPEASGADRRVLKVPEGILKLAVEARTIRRAIFAIGSEGSLGFVAYPGVPESETREVDWYDARFDLGSLSQAVGTTTAAMLLVDSGKLLLGARVRDYLPEFQGAKKEMVRVHHLLAHASGLPDPLPGLPEKPTAAQLLRAACSAPLEFEPGKKTKPSAADMVLLDEIIARASGRMAGQLLASRLFTPLGLKGTSYRAAAGSDEGKSLWSTPYDLAVFSQWLLNRGIYNHRRYVNPDTIARFTGAPAALPEGRSLGWSKPSPEHWTGRVFSASAFGYDAANGCSLWIDPETHTFIVFLAEPARPDAKLDDLRRSIFEKMLLEGQIR